MKKQQNGFPIPGKSKNIIYSGFRESNITFDNELFPESQLEDSDDEHRDIDDPDTLDQWFPMQGIRPTRGNLTFLRSNSIL